MKKRLTTIIVMVIMLFSAVGTVAPAQAATTPFMTVNTDMIKEKVGSYYIWIKEYENKQGQIVSELRTSKSANGKGKVIKTVTDPSSFSDIISNGQTIYYGVENWNKSTLTIYKAPVAGGKNTVFRTVKNVRVSGGPVTVFENRLYYYRDADRGDGYITWDLYSVTLKNKNCRLEKKDVVGQSGYGRYITCDNEFKDKKTELYNVKTRKSTPLIKSWLSRVYNGSVYYALYDDNYYYIKKSNLSGKQLKTISKVPRDGWYLEYLGKKMAYFKNADTGKYKQIVY